MTHRERLETAWAFREPDRVPIELELPAKYRSHPSAARLVELVDEHADNFCWAHGPQAGFFGLPSTAREEVIEERPGEYIRKRLFQETPVGQFTAITYKPADNADPADFHWEKRYITTLDNLARLADAERQPMAWDRAAYLARVAEIGERGIPFMGLFHPLGGLVRNATMEEVYTWFHEAPDLVHRFLKATNDQVIATVSRMQPEPGARLAFMSWAHEMLITPWMGFDLFDEFVKPYDAEVYAAVHRAGGRFRAHCHGRCMAFLTRFADMGIDAVEPLEHEPMGDVDLAEAKRLVGGRMLFSGNVASEQFIRMTADEVRRQVRYAINAAAPGGGFTLHTSGAGPDSGLTGDALEHVIRMCETYMLAGLEHGRYPIRP